MFERDYIMKQINQLISVLNRILAIVFKLQKQSAEEVSFSEVNELLEEYLALSIEDLLNLPEEELIKKLIQDLNMTNEPVGQLGDLLYEISKITSEIPYSREALLKRALFLYEYVESADEIYSLDRHFRKEEVINLLDES